jgi:steroid delta-isomerase-like uncharacterized protein
MSFEQNKAMARRFVMEHNQAEYLASFEALLAPDCLVHEYLPGLPEAMDRVGYNGFIAMFRSALPDIRNSVEDVIAEGDKVVVRWTGYGTHTGAPLMGVPSNGAVLKAHGVYILRFSNGKIAEVWNNWDNLNVMQQLGALPAPA